MPPAKTYVGRVFHLSQDYPREMPSEDQKPAFLKLDFKSDWRKYIMAVRDYCFAGNIQGGDVADDWNVAADSPPRWFHMPWQHFGPSGREGIHGLTREAPVVPRQLAWSQTASGQTYAVGFFNVFGGYGIGQVWADHDRPDTTKALFPDGTVICKLLFVDIPPEQVPSLVNPVQWEGYITETFTATKRKIGKLSLIQMDIAVKHPGAPTGWLFGTFQYNGALRQRNRWENLVPVGLMWGNDPEIRVNDSNPMPISTRINPQIKETVINPDTQRVAADASRLERAAQRAGRQPDELVPELPHDGTGPGELADESAVPGEPTGSRLQRVDAMVPEPQVRRAFRPEPPGQSDRLQPPARREHPELRDVARRGDQDPRRALQAHADACARRSCATSRFELQMQDSEQPTQFKIQRDFTPNQ